MAGEVHGTSRVRLYPVVETTAFSEDHYSSAFILTASDMYNILRLLSQNAVQNSIWHTHLKFRNWQDTSDRNMHILTVSDAEKYVSSLQCFMDLRVETIVLHLIHNVSFYVSNFICCEGQSQWPRGLRRRSAAVRLLGSWVRVPQGAWTFFCCGCCVCCQVEVSATNWPLVQGSPTYCGASLCVTSKPHEWGARIKQVEPKGDACSK